ncbi:MAG: hypothetical protein IT425_09320 [Pirellulales bacterium]|nr:hypothetical protein [Pirellulales bacterium]
MRVQQLLEHHGIAVNPFAEEDAQSDPVFKERCRDLTYHPAWDKVYGDPAEPATSIVFGEKGAGKTAMRMQMVGRIALFNARPENGRLFVIEYDDFNPFLDHFADRLSARKQRDPAKVLAEWKLWDHMDAILSLGVTSLVDRLLGVPQPTGPEANQVTVERTRTLDRHQKRDLLVLTACYDNSTRETVVSRWASLRRKLRYHTWTSWCDRVIGSLVTAAVVAITLYSRKWEWLVTPWPYLIVLLGWLPWLARLWKWFWVARRIGRNVRALKPNVGSLRRLLMRFPKRDIDGQPLPESQRTDDRFELFAKFQGVLKALGCDGIIVLVDRVDEPHLITGSVDRMRALIWSMLENKFLKQPGVGLKLLLPRELVDFMQREDRDFYQRARLDKQNMIPSLEWTGQALYDLANSRIRSCGANGKKPVLRALLDESIADERLIDAFRALRVPRHLFKFLYRLLVAHCNAHTDDKPVWVISKETFEATLAVYSRDQDAVDRGLQAG